MTAVKGSEQYRLVVVPYRPWRKVLISLVLLLLVALGVAASYWYGQQQVKSQSQGSSAELKALQQDLKNKALEVDSLRQEVANLKLGSQVDRKASEGVKTEVIELKGQIAKLQEEAGFYRSLMTPNGPGKGLTIGSLDVIARDVPRQYSYKVVVQQLATKHSTLNGYLTFKLVGYRGDKLVTMDLKDLSRNIDAEKIKLRFKYFQALEGTLTLPEDFEPVRIELMARSNGPEDVMVEKKFGWLVQET